MSPDLPDQGATSVAGSGAENEKVHWSLAKSILTNRFFPGQFESYTRTIATSSLSNSTAYGNTAWPPRGEYRPNTYGVVPI